MKRSCVLVFTLLIVLVSSSAFATPRNFAGMTGGVGIGVDVPSNWDAVKETTANTANNATVPCITLTDKSDPNRRWFMIYLALAEEDTGRPLTLPQVGNNMLVGYQSRGSRQVNDQAQNSGYYSFDYFVGQGVTMRYIFTGKDYDSRIKDGYYLTYHYTFDMLETSEVNAIIDSITIDGAKRSTGTSEQGGATTQEGGTGTGGGNTTGQEVGGSGGGGGGCSAGLGSLALIVLCSAFIVRKSS